MRDGDKDCQRCQYRCHYIGEKYSDFLQSLDWQYFLTVTFRRLRRDAIRAHEQVWECLNSLGLSGRAFLATEPHYIGSGVHVHGLYKVESHLPEVHQRYLSESYIWHGLFNAFGRTTVERINSREDVTAYCSKYVVKGTSEYDFYGQANLWDVPLDIP